MADQVLVDNGAEADYTVSTDDAGAAGQVQRVKLAYSADGVATHVPADADGLLVNLGANNDITGTVTAELSAVDNAVLDAMVVDLAAIEVLLGTIDADTGNLAAILTALQLIDNMIAVLGTATYAEGTTSGAVMGAVRRDADTTLVNTTNEIGPLQMDANGRLKVEVFSGETLPVSGTITANLSATDNQVLDDIETAVDGIETLLGTIDADTGSMLTALQIMDDWDQSDRAKVNAQDVSGVMIENGIEVTVKYAAIDFAGSGDNTLVAAVAGKKIRVLSLFLVAAGTVTVRFENGAGGTALTGQMNLVANTGFALPHNPHGWFQAGTDNTLLNMELSAAISVDGSLTYIEAE